MPARRCIATVEVASPSSLIKSREDSGSGRIPIVSSGMMSVADQRAVRLLERWGYDA